MRASIFIHIHINICIYIYIYHMLAVFVRFACCACVLCLLTVLACCSCLLYLLAVLASCAYLLVGSVCLQCLLAYLLHALLCLTRPPYESG